MAHGQAWLPSTGGDGKPFYSSAMRCGVRGGGVELHDALARGRVTAGGQNFPVPGGMLETAENLRREYSARCPRRRRRWAGPD